MRKAWQSRDRLETWTKDADLQADKWNLDRTWALEKQDAGVSITIGHSPKKSTRSV